MSNFFNTRGPIRVPPPVHQEEVLQNPDDEYEDEDDDFQGGRPRLLDPAQEAEIIQSFFNAGQGNREFIKVLDILQRDEELRPLIFEHESLLTALKDIKTLKAEQMLSILTAAETEMYESSRN